MKVLNLPGMAYHLHPLGLDNLGDTTKVSQLSFSASTDIIFFDGIMPSANELRLVIDKPDLINKYGTRQLMQVNNIVLSHTYNKDKKQRLIKKTPIDAVECQFSAVGSIGWCAIIFNDTNGIATSSLLFTDSIGQWGDEYSMIILDKKTSVAVSDKNVFKDISLIVRDSSNYEGM